MSCRPNIVTDIKTTLIQQGAVDQDMNIIDQDMFSQVVSNIKPVETEIDEPTVSATLQDSLKALLNGRLKDQVIFTDNIEATYRTFDNYDEIYESLSLANELGVNDLFVIEYFKSNKLKVAANKIKTPEQLYEQIARDIESEFSSDKFMVAPLTREKQLKEYEKAKARDIENTGVVSQQTQMMQREDYWERTVEEVNRQREENLKEWRNYITKENPEYSQNPALQYLFWKAITKEYNVNKTTYKSQPPVLNRRVLADLYQKFMDKEVLPTTASFKSAYDNMLVDYIKQTSVITQVTGKDTSVGEWITIKGQKSDPDNFQDNVKRLRSLAYTSWCVKTSMAESYLKKGDFHIYIEKNDKVTDDFLASGQDISEAGIQNVKVGVGANAGGQIEVQGQLNDNRIPLDYYNQIVEFIDIKEKTGDVDVNQLKRTRKQLDEATERIAKIKDYRKKLKRRRLVKFKNTEQYLKESGSTYYKRPDGKFVVQEFMLFDLKTPIVVPDVVELGVIVVPEEMDYSAIDSLTDGEIESLIENEQVMEYIPVTTYFPDVEIVNSFLTYKNNNIKVTPAPGLSEDLENSLSIINKVIEETPVSTGRTVKLLELRDLAIRIKLPSTDLFTSVVYDTYTNQAIRLGSAEEYYTESGIKLVKTVEESPGFFVADLKPDGTIGIFETDNLEEAKSVLKSSIDNYHVVKRAQDPQPYDKLRIVKRSLHTDKPLPSLVIANHVELVGDAPNLEVITGNMYGPVPKNVKYIIGQISPTTTRTYPGTSPVVIEMDNDYNPEVIQLSPIAQGYREMLLQQITPLMDMISLYDLGISKEDLDLEISLAYDKVYNKILEVAPEVINENLKYRDLIDYISNRGVYVNENRVPIYRTDVIPNPLQTSRVFNQGIQAFYNKADGKVYVSTKLSPQEQAQVLLHEVIGHKGIEELLSDVEYREYKNILFGARDFLYQNAEALIARTGHKSLQDLANDYQFDLNTEKGQLGLIKELLARQAEVNPNLSWFERLVGRLQIFLAKVFGTDMSREGVIELLLLSRDKLNNPNLRLDEVLKTTPVSVPLVIPLNNKAQINTAYADSLESPSNVDVMDSFLDELLLTGEIEVQPSGLFFTDGYTFETREELKTYIQNKPTANLVTHHFYPSLELKGRTAREAVDQIIDEYLVANELTKEKDYYQAEGRLTANRVAKELNKYFKTTVVVAVGDRIKVQVPHQLYAAYEPKEVISTENIDNPYADVYVANSFPVLFGDANTLKTYDPTIAESIVRIMQAKKNIGLVVKSHAPSLFWKTLEQLNLASVVDGTYYYVGGLLDQKTFDNAYAQLIQNPNNPINVTGIDEFSEVVGTYQPMNGMDLMYCNV